MGQQEVKWIYTRRKKKRNNVVIEEGQRGLLPRGTEESFHRLEDKGRKEARVEVME